jgi:hypothetical protein
LVRSPPWYVNEKSFKAKMPSEIISEIGSGLPFGFLEKQWKVVFDDAK